VLDSCIWSVWFPSGVNIGVSYCLIIFSFSL
jgi:hypothetical protein